MVAIVGAVALAASLAPVALAAGLSAAKGEEAASLESVRTVVLGGDDAPFAASFDVRDGEPDCTREFALTIGAHQFTCGDVVIETRSAVDVEAPDLRPAETPRAPGLIAWSGSPVENVYGTVYRVIVLGEEDAEADDEAGASAIVAIVSGDGDAVDDAAATILADVRAGEE